MRLTLALLVLSSALAAQTLQVTVAPAPGGVGTAQLVNTTPTAIIFSQGCALFTLTPGGDLARVPLFAGLTCDIAIFVSPGATRSLSFLAPTRPGSYLLLFSAVNLGGQVFAATRLDVGTPSASFPALVPFPSTISWPQGGHAVDFSNPAQVSWAIANTTAAAHTFVTGDVLDVVGPGGIVPLGIQSLAGTSVPAGGVARVPLPVIGLGAGPYTVRTQWSDPGLLAPRTVEQGIRAQGSGADLHFTTGRTLAPGGALSADLLIGGLNLFGGSSAVYALLLGISGGVTVLPGGAIFPLVNDPLLQASLANGVGGLQTGHLGVVPTPIGFLAPGQVTGIGLAHPGVPLGGLRIRAAAVVLDPVLGQVGVSQGEVITLL